MTDAWENEGGAVQELAQARERQAQLQAQEAARDQAWAQLDAERDTWRALAAERGRTLNNVTVYLKHALALIEAGAVQEPAQGPDLVS